MQLLMKDKAQLVNFFVYTNSKSIKTFEDVIITDRIQSCPHADRNSRPEKESLLGVLNIYMSQFGCAYQILYPFQEIQIITAQATAAIRLYLATSEQYFAQVQLKRIREVLAGFRVVLGSSTSLNLPSTTAMKKMRVPWYFSVVLELSSTCMALGTLMLEEY